MGTHGLRLLGWAVHLAFFVAWWQVALLMDGQMHGEPAAPVRDVAASGLSQGAATSGQAPARRPQRAEAASAAGAEVRARAAQLGMRAT